MNQTFLVTPFASLGDQTVVPIPTDPNGYVSFQQGWGPDYAADPATDANAKDIDRANTNYLFFIITQALAALQGETIPEWITAANNGGTAYSYGQGACVLYSASGNAPFTVYRSLIANNTQTPGTGNNWQVEIYQAASSTDIVAGTSNALIVTPLALTSYPGNSSQTFSVGAAITATQAAQAGQVQKAAFNYAGLAGGTANAITASISPAPTAYTDDLCVIVRVASNNPGSVSLNVNGLGTVAVIGAGHQLLQGGELVAGGFACFAYSSNFSEFILLWATGGALQIAPATASQHAVQLGQVTSAGSPLQLTTQTAVSANQAVPLSQVQSLLGLRNSLITSSGTFTVPAGVTQMFVTAVGGGAGGGGGGAATGASSSSSGGGGGGGGIGASALKQAISVAPGQILTITIGAGGNGGAGGNSGTSAQAGTSGGTTSITGSSPTVSVSLAGGSPGNPGGAGASNTIGTPGAAGGATAGAGTFGFIASGIGSTGGSGGAGSSTWFGPGGGQTPQSGGSTNGSVGNNGLGRGSSGSGGGGASVLTATGTNNGGAGGTGIGGAVLLEW